MFLFHQNQPIHVPLISFQIKKLRKLYMKIWLSSFFDNSEGEEADIWHTMLLVGHQLELVVFSAFGEHATIQFFLPLLPWHTFSSWTYKLFNRDRGSETHAPSPLCSELSGQLFCYVYLRLCVWSALGIGTLQVSCFF